MALEDDITLLSRQPLLGQMPREALRLIAFAAETRILRSGDIIFRKGEAADAGYFVVSGSVALDEGDNGAPAAVIAGSGALMGEMALFIECERPATAIARETCTVMKLPRAVIKRVLAEFPESAASIHQALASRVRSFSNELRSVRASLAAPQS